MITKARYLPFNSEFVRKISKKLSFFFYIKIHVPDLEDDTRVKAQ
jgi:hypothetical protein